MNEQVTAAAIRLHPADNVVVAARAMPAGAAVAGESILCARAIPAGHKVATAPIGAGEAPPDFAPPAALEGRAVARPPFGGHREGCEGDRGRMQLNVQAQMAGLCKHEELARHRTVTETLDSHTHRVSRAGRQLKGAVGTAEGYHPHAVTPPHHHHGGVGDRPPALGLSNDARDRLP